MCAQTLSIALTLLSLGTPDVPPSLHGLHETFSQPTREFTSGPLWVWNDDLSEAQIVATLEDLAGQNVRQAFVHPRPGLMTPYLSERWFALWKLALATAERLDMNIWIYDENSYPSGFAGGFVPEAMPESRGIGLRFEEAAQAPASSEDLLAVYRLVGETAEEVSDAVRAGGDPGTGPFLLVKVEQAKTSPWFGGWSYVDLLRPGVTEKFLEITMGAYEREIGEHFGKRMPGVFTDEPHLRPGGAMHWTPDLPEQFAARRGYALEGNLASLVKPVGDWRRVRHDYYRTLLELFIERWAKPYYTYCDEKGLEFTGHYWEHDWPNCTTAPDNMAMYAWHQRPAIDTLFNQYDEGVHAQFGNVRAVLELSSVANQLGKQRTLCEAYGGAGWETRLEDMKRIGDWLFVLGVNTMDEHLSRISMRGARKADYPPSFSYHSPWWPAYHVPATYFARLSVALTHGEQRNEILVLEPTSTAWMYQGEPADHRNTLGNEFQALVTELAQAQVEFDLGNENIIEHHGRVADGRFVVGERAYHTVVIPAHTETLNETTARLLSEFSAAGGEVIACDAVALDRIDGVVSARARELGAGWRTVAACELESALRAQCDGATPQIHRAPGDQGILYHHRRVWAGGQMLFLVNSSLENTSHSTLKHGGFPVRQWDLETGTVTPFATDQAEIAITLPPAGSLLLEWETAPGSLAVPPALVAGAALSPAGPLVVTRDAPNVLMLDFVDVTAGGETLTGVHFSRAAEFAFQQHGQPHNPWDHAVQFNDQLVRVNFPDDSGFVARYRFNVAGAPPEGLQLAVESPELYTVTCNGAPLPAEPGAWWFDKATGLLALGEAVREGENLIELRARPFTMRHEIAAVALLGDFSLVPTASGYTITHAADLTPGPWRAQGMPFYGDSVRYRQSFEIATPAAHRVSLGTWHGSVAEVLVNDTAAGYIWRQPWTLDVRPELLQAGANTITVRVVGTPRNTFGPHHGDAAPGLAGPEHFRRAPESGPPAGDAYSLVDYGLFEAFQLLPLEEE